MYEISTDFENSVIPLYNFDAFFLDPDIMSAWV